MKLRPSIAVVVCSLVVVACGSGDDGAPISVEVTLIPTTATVTTTTEPVFVPVESDPAAGSYDVDDDSTDDQPSATDVDSTDSSTDTSGTDTAVDATDTTTVTADSEPPGTAASTTPDPPAVTTFTLETDGLGSTSFGADPDGTIDFVSNFFGEPTADTGWVDPFDVGDGSCGGSQLRLVNWGDLRLEFGDVSTIRQDQVHFFAYTYGAEGSLGEATPPGLATPLGISAGSTVGRLVAAYPATELRASDSTIAANFVINANLTGRMSGLADDDVVESIIGGFPCGV